MSVKNQKDYVYLIWQNEINRRNYVVGELVKNGGFEFHYGHEIDEAVESGFKPMIPFLDKDKIYRSDLLFPAFSSRLPDSKRKDMDKILQKYGLKEFDEYMLLKRSGAKLPIDNLSFIDPIFSEGFDTLSRQFYVSGPRHCMECGGKKCENSTVINENEKLILVPEPTNEHDANAIEIRNSDNKKIGYVPRYYCGGILAKIAKGFSAECTVLCVNKADNMCNECIKVLLTLVCNKSNVAERSV